MRSVPISHSITGPLARSIGAGFTGAERGKALTNAGGLSGPPFGVHYSAHPSPRGDGNQSAAQAPRWVSCWPDWFLPVLVLSPVFRGKYLAALRQAYHAGELQFAGSTAPLASP